MELTSVGHWWVVAAGKRIVFGGRDARVVTWSARAGVGAEGGRGMGYLRGRRGVLFQRGPAGGVGGAWCAWVVSLISLRMVPLAQCAYVGRAFDYIHDWAVLVQRGAELSRVGVGSEGRGD